MPFTMAREGHEAACPVQTSHASSSVPKAALSALVFLASVKPGYKVFLSEIKRSNNSERVYLRSNLLQPHLPAPSICHIYPVQII